MANYLGLSGTSGAASWTLDAATTALLPLGHVTVQLRIWQSLIPAPDSLYATWPLDETSGNTRLATFGSAASADLAETGGAVSTMAGKYGLAVSRQSTQTTRLLGTISTVDLSGGFTLACWIKPPAFPAAATGFNLILLSLGTGGFETNPGVLIYRLHDSDRLVADMLTGPPDNADIFTPSPYLGLTLGEWQLVIISYDPATSLFSSYHEDGTALHAAITPAQAAVFTAIDTLQVGGTWSTSKSWEGGIDELMLWTTVLTAGQRAVLLNRESTDMRGELTVLDPATGVIAATTTLTNADGYTAALSNGVCVQGEAFSTAVTLRDGDGNLVDLTDAKGIAQFLYEPEGSSTRLPNGTVVTSAVDVIITGTVFYHSPDDGDVAWPGATVHLYDSALNLMATTVTVFTDFLSPADYTFTNAIGPGQVVFVKVDVGEIPPTMGAPQTGTGTDTTIAGTVTIDVYCTA